MANLREAGSSTGGQQILILLLLTLLSSVSLIAQTGNGSPSYPAPAQAAPQAVSQQPPGTTPSVASPGSMQSGTAQPATSQPGTGTTTNPAPVPAQSIGGSPQSPANAGQPSPAPSQPQDTPGMTPEVPQTPDTTGEGTQYVFRKQVEEVVLHATVSDEQRRLITDLERGAFTVYEDGKPQTITSFRREEVPIALGIVIDNSGSMRDKRPRVNRAAIDLVRAINPKDQVFVVNFGREAYLDQDFTSNVGELQRALDQVQSRGGTALYDAMRLSADHVKEAQINKRVLFVVTDGEDNVSRETLKDVLAELQQENGPTVYAIGLFGGQTDKPTDKQLRARRDLQAVADASGGLAFFPQDVSEIDNIGRIVAHDIRNQYVIGYRPSRPMELGGYRSIRVEARNAGSKRLLVRTRTGYYAGREQANASSQ
ncbi:MAG TPA: VWA domain-containing protein [Terriglobales bacterium]|nr:VWA domain-containing protein [Terriglobales bacterium]